MPNKCFNLNPLSNVVLKMIFGLWTLSLVRYSTVVTSVKSQIRQKQSPKIKVQRSVLIIKKAAFRAASRCSFCCRSLNNYDAFVFVKISQHHLDNFALLRRHQFADEIRLNRQFAVFVPAINQHRKLHPSRPSKIDELIERGAHSATRIKHIVDQNDRAPFDVARQFGAADNRLGADSRKIVAIQSDVEDAYGRPGAFQVSDFVSDAVGQRDAATADANQKKIGQAVVL